MNITTALFPHLSSMGSQAVVTKTRSGAHLYQVFTPRSVSFTLTIPSGAWDSSVRRHRNRCAGHKNRIVCCPIIYGVTLKLLSFVRYEGILPVGGVGLPHWASVSVCALEQPWVCWWWAVGCNRLLSLHWFAWMLTLLRNVGEGGMITIFYYLL